MMLGRSALPPAYLLFLVTFIPSNLCFQLTTNFHCRRRYRHAVTVTPRSQSPILSTRQRSIRGFQIEAFWRSSSSYNDDDGSDNDKAETGEEKKQDEDENNSSSLELSPLSASTEPSPSSTSIEPSPSSASIEPSPSSTSKAPSSFPVETESSSEFDVQATPKKSSNKDHEKSLLTLFNDIGNNFKPMAKKAIARGYQSEDQAKKILFAAKACLYYTLFIIYRSYRGFIVLLPATFRQVYIKMESAMKSGLSMEEIGSSSKENPTINWKTKLTVSLLAGVVMISYVIGAALKMASKFVRTIAKTSSIQKSFEAAADEILVCEERIGRVGKVNGDDSVEPSGLAP